MCSVHPNNDDFCASSNTVFTDLVGPHRCCQECGCLICVAAHKKHPDRCCHCAKFTEGRDWVDEQPAWPGYYRWDQKKAEDDWLEYAWGQDDPR